MKKIIIHLIISIAVLSCHNKDGDFDASGVFEADETIVSSEVGGRIVEFSVNEGDSLNAGQTVGVIDAENLELQKQQVEASIQSLQQKTSDVQPQVRFLEDQIRVQQSQLSNLEREKIRVENLIKADAATGKQLDDIKAQIDVTQKQIAASRQQINVQKNAVATQNRSVLSETSPLKKRAEQLQDQLNRSKIENPLKGTVITRYAERGEITTPGKPLYKIADLSQINLKAYVTGDQLSDIRLGSHATVIAGNKENERRYDGVITWISDKAEFTPKTIQTRDERANLVYAMKIRVKNDGLLKLGMYADVLFKK